MSSQPSLAHLRNGPFAEPSSAAPGARSSPDAFGASSASHPAAAATGATTTTTTTDAPFPTSKAAEQFSAIYTILRHERAARKSLEKQVAVMQRELQELRALTTRLATSTSTSYPTPSPDALQSTERESGPTEAGTSSNRTTILARPPQPRVRTSSRENRDDAEKRETITSRFSRYDDSGDEEGASGTTSGKTSSPELYETPREESVPYGFGFGTVQTARAVTVGVGESAAAKF